jgi:hypothetical protein
MDFVIFDTLDTDRLKGSEADVQSDIDGFDAALADAVENFSCEVKAGGGGGDRSAVLGVDGLIALAIVGGIRARDVGRKRDVADAVEGGKEVVGLIPPTAGLKADATLAEFGARENLGLQFVVFAEKQAFADPDLAAGTNQALPIVGICGELAGEQNFDAAVEKIAGRGILRAERLSAGALAAAIQASGKDASVIEDEQIAGLKQAGEVPKLAIGILAAGSLEVEHAGGIANGGGFLGDEFLGKMEVEVGNLHGVRL